MNCRLFVIFYSQKQQDCQSRWQDHGVSCSHSNNVGKRDFHYHNNNNFSSVTCKFPKTYGSGCGGCGHSCPGDENYCCSREWSIIWVNGDGCFPSTGRVNLKNGKSVTMSELNVGDQVQTGK